MCGKELTHQELFINGLELGVIRILEAHGLSQNPSGVMGCVRLPAMEEPTSPNNVAQTSIAAQQYM